MSRAGEGTIMAIMEETMAVGMMEEIMTAEIEIMIITEEMTTIEAEIATAIK